jgi:hypothetical protein
MERAMDSQHSGDMIDASRYSVDELREAVFEGQGRVARPLALALLSRKQYPNKVQDMQKILLDEAEQPRLRTLAASALAGMQTPASLRALELGVKARESVTLRAVAKALADRGGQKHVKTLQTLARTPGPVGRDAQRALGVLTQRLKVATPARRAAAPVRTLPVQATGKPTPIRVRAAAAGEVASAVKSLPTRKLARRGAVSLDCQGRKLVFVFDEPSLHQGVEMFSRGGEIGIVAEPPGVESTAWSPRYRVSVEPQRQGAFRVVVTTHDGRPVLVGSGKQEGRQATFELSAADLPGALPVEIRGRFDGAKVTVEQARSGLRRRASRTPSQEGRAQS